MKLAQLITILTASLLLASCHTGSGHSSIRASDSFLGDDWYQARVGVLPVRTLPAMKMEGRMWKGRDMESLDEKLGDLFRDKYDSHRRLYSPGELLKRASAAKINLLGEPGMEHDPYPRRLLQKVGETLKMRYLVVVMYHGANVQPNVGLMIAQAIMDSQSWKNQPKMQYRAVISLQIYDVQKKRFIIEGLAAGTSRSGGLGEVLAPRHSWTSEEKAIKQAMKAVVSDLRWYRRADTQAAPPE